MQAGRRGRAGLTTPGRYGPGNAGRAQGGRVGAGRAQGGRVGAGRAQGGRVGAGLRNASPARRNPPRLAPCEPGTTATGRTYGALVHRETRPEGSRWAFDIPVPGAVGQAWRARPARVSEKPRSGRRGTGVAGSTRAGFREAPFRAPWDRRGGLAGGGDVWRRLVDTAVGSEKECSCWPEGEDGPPGMTFT